MSPTHPSVRYIRRLPDGSFQGAPSNQGPWRPIPDPRPPRHLVAVPAAPGQGNGSRTAPGPTLWRRAFAAMAAADERAWAHLDAIDQTDGPEAAGLEALGLADRFAAEAMLTTIRLAVVNHLHDLGVHTAARMVGSWFDQQIIDACKGE